MEDLERRLEQAILVTHDPSAHPELFSKADSFIDGFTKSDPPAAVRFSLSRLSSSASPPAVHFWCLQTLLPSLPSLPSSDLHLLRSILLSLAGGALPSTSPSFLKNKLAQSLAVLIALDSSPSPFLHLLSLLPSSADSLLRLLTALDDDLISQDYQPQSPSAGRVKDAIRAQCAPQLARALFDIARSDPALAAAALDVTRRYVSWIDLSLVANDAFLPLLFDLHLNPASPEPLRHSAAECLLAVSKRMDPLPKLTLLQNLRVFSLAPTLITGYATEALKCYKQLDSQKSSAALELVEEALPSLFSAMREMDCFTNMVDLLLDYVATLRSWSPPSQQQRAYLTQMLEAILSQISFDPKYRDNLDAPDKVGRDLEDQMNELRRDMFTLFRSVCRVAPDVAQSFIRNLLAGRALMSSDTNVEEVEAVLSLFYCLGETVSEEGMKTGSGLLGELVPMLLSARFPCHSYRIVALVYLETITRYLKFVQENDRYIPHVLAAFLDERGVHHPNLNVSRRASYLFMRAVKLLRPKLLPFIDTIMHNLQDTITQFTRSNCTSEEMKCSGSGDGSQTFEAIGLLIGMEDVSSEKQAEYLTAMINPLQRQVETLLFDAKVEGLQENSGKVLCLQQIILALNALSKGFNERLVTSTRPAVGIVFKQMLDVLLQILVMFPNIKPLRNKFTSFLHRMVEILGASMLPCLPVAFEQLLVGSEAKDMVDFLLLINQVISKFNTSAERILEEIFPTIASRLFNILSSDALPSGPDYNAENIRELQELQRTLYNFLHVMTMNVSSVFLAPKSRGFMDRTMQLLLLSSCNHKDMLLRKLCVQIFIKLTKDWCSRHTSEDKVPGFRSFIIEKFATNCCLYSVLDKSFEFRDANTLLLFGEIVMAQMVMYERFGGDFINYFVSEVLPSAHCPQHLVELYSETLQGNDIKAFRSFYKSLIENLRQQENDRLFIR